MKAEGKRHKVEGEKPADARWLTRAFSRLRQALRPGFCLLLAPSTFCLLPSAFCAPATGAKIDESKVVNTYYVDAAGANAADDNEHGTQDAPFLTIKRALNAALRDKDANIGARVIIGPGTYRETIDVPAPADRTVDTDAPLVIEAAERDQTIIDCADVVKLDAGSWKTGEPAVVMTWGNVSLNGGMTRRAPLMILDGVVLRQMEPPSTLMPGTFSVAETRGKKPETKVLTLPPEGVELTAASVFAVGVRTSGLAIYQRKNVIVRGLLIQHASRPDLAPPSGISRPLVGIDITDCSNVLIEDVLSQWNDGPGLSITTQRTDARDGGITLKRVRLIHNGDSGFTGANLKNLLVEDCETSFNNFRGEWTGNSDQAGPAGVKVHGVHGSTWRRQRAVANFGRGLWWSGDCTNLLVEDAVVHDNLLSGLFIENCPGPSVVRGCLITGNRLPATSKPEVSQPAAVSLEASPDVTLENNVVAGNLMPQLGLRDVVERTDGINFETGAKLTLRAERHVYRHNAFYGADADQTLVNLPVADRAGKGDFAFYYATLDSDENCFWNAASAEVFCTYDRTAYRRPGMALAGWKTFLSAHADAGNGGQGDRRPEAGSSWEDPRFMEPGEGDYRLQAQSPLIDWGLPSEEGAAQ